MCWAKQKIVVKMPYDIFTTILPWHVWKTCLRVQAQLYSINTCSQHVRMSSDVVTCSHTCQHTFKLYRSTYTLLLHVLRRALQNMSSRRAHIWSAWVYCSHTCQYTCEMYRNHKIPGAHVFKYFTRVSKLVYALKNFKTPVYCTWPLIHVLVHVLS